MEQIEIKRKVFDIIQPLGEKSFLCSRKNKQYFVKDFADDKASFEAYVETEWKLNATGIKHPKIYVYDKDKHIAVSEYIEGETILDILMKESLSEDIFDAAFRVNWFMRKDHLPISYDPARWKWHKDNLYFVGSLGKKYDDNLTFEKSPIRLWFYTKDFVTYLSKRDLPIDKSRFEPDQGKINKEIALTVVKHFI